MRPIDLTPRLKTIASLIPAGARVADVGADHGRLPVWLLEQGSVETAIATDIAAGPLEAARRTAQRHKLTHRLSLRQGDGLAPVSPGEVDTVVIAGMGGETIAAILAAAPWTREGKRLILQPMTSAHDLRRWLTENGYFIQRETLVEDGKLYVILEAAGGRDVPMTPAELLVGRQWEGMASPLRSKYLQQAINRTQKALIQRQRALADPEKAPIDPHQPPTVPNEALLEALKALLKEWLSWQKGL